MRVLIVGCGYVGVPLGAELARRGHEVFGLRRTSGNADELRGANIEPLIADITQPQTLSALPREFDWVVNTVASTAGDEEDYRRTYLQGTKNLIDWLAPAMPRAFVYTSSTGVYGQNDGSIVTEENVTEPDSVTTRVLIETEQMLLCAARESKFPAMILRCAGIYGPGRGYWLRQFLAGEATMQGSGERWLNMIHRDDVGAAVIAALDRGQPGEVYNAVDDEPVQQRTVFAWLAQRLRKPMPPSVAERSGPGRRAVTDKRVSNQKLRLALRCKLKYPTFREGYAAELARVGLCAD
ncbi:MAG TPA: SDR family oxidoreductase [Candidatus Acidoferrum sp.]|nr:SDR family oxidoreductase [Candidatus Acidoferrum sp.]